MGALLVGLPAVYFYLWDQEDDLGSAESGEMRTPASINSGHGGEQKGGRQKT